MTADADVPDRLGPLFAAIDARDTEAFLGFLTNDAVFRFGSAPPVSGQGAVREAVAGFFTTIAGSRHALVNCLADGRLMACEGEVTYRRHDGSELTLPFTNMFEFDGELISHYRIYIDIAPLYAD